MARYARHSIAYTLILLLVLACGTMADTTLVHPQNLISAVVNALTVSTTLTVTGATSTGALTSASVTASDLTASTLVVADANKKLASNGSITTNAVPKSASSGATLVASAISDDGTAVTISSNLIDSGLTATRIVATNGSKQLGSLGAFSTNTIPKGSSSTLTDGTLLDTGSEIISIKPVYAFGNVETVSTTKTPVCGGASSESGETYRNANDVDGQSVTLPNDPSDFCEYGFGLTSTDTSNNFAIAPSAGETLFDGASQCSTSITATAKGATLHIKAYSTGSGGVWLVIAKTGTWTCT